MEINNLSFRAKHIATTKNIYKNISTKIDLYELGKHDKDFLQNLKKKVNYSERIQNLSEYSTTRWQRVFNYAIESATNLRDTKTYMAFSNSKPCGIMTFIEDCNKLYLDCICDIPQKNGERVNYTGSTLFCELFKYANDIKAKSITLSAVPDGPFDVVSKYKAKGFKIIDQAKDYVEMECSKFKAKEQLDKLLSEISYKPVKNNEETNLNEFI